MMRITTSLPLVLFVLWTSFACSTDDNGGSDVIIRAQSAADAKGDTKGTQDGKGTHDTQSSADGVALDSQPTSSDADVQLSSVEIPDYRFVYLPENDEAASSKTGEICAWQDPGKVSMDDQMKPISAEWDKWSDEERETCFWARFGGRTLVEDKANGGFVLNEKTGDVSFDQSELGDLVKELGVLDEIPCVAKEDLQDGPPSTLPNLTKGKGTDTLPEMDKTWKGYDKGGCSLWATLMCDRILGESSGDVTKDEWNALANTLDPDGDGAVSISDSSDRYRDLGYTVTLDTDFEGTKADYQMIKDALERGCDVKMSFASVNQTPAPPMQSSALPEYFNGHQETVTGVDVNATSVSTNSWGESATISGGTHNDFNHSLDTEFGLSENPEDWLNWPPDSTNVILSIICPPVSGIFDTIFNYFFGSK